MPIHCFSQMKRWEFWLVFSLLLIVCGVTPSCGQSLRRDEGRGVYAANFVKNPSVRLQGSVLAKLMVSNYEICVLECINNRHCFSINFAASLDGKPSCELLNTDKFINSDGLVADVTFDHYNIKTPCMSSPCANGGACSPIYIRDEYQCVCQPGFNGDHCHEKEKWIQMNPSSVCFGARNDTYGAFTVPMRGQIFTFKLKYLSGSISCDQGKNYTSRWGCTGLPSHPMGTLITGSNNRNPILPGNQYLKGGYGCLKQYYNLPWANVESDELLFDNFTTPLSVSVGQEFQVWFVEDLDACFENDNGPQQTCAAVYGWYV